MNPNREEALFALALAKPAAKRAAWLDAECEGDSSLRARLESLLVAHEQPETLLATQAKTARPTIKLDLTDAPDEAVGQTLGRYKLLERVGEGGCGVVYVAEQTEPVRRRVALNLLMTELVRSGLSTLTGVEILTPREASMCASMITFRTKTVPYDQLFGRLLKDHAIRARPVTEQGLNALRVSTHLFNSPAECERLVSGVEKILRSA